MTDAEKIKKLAEWMGGTFKHGALKYKAVIHTRWNPLAHIADAWMLVEKMKMAKSSTWYNFWVEHSRESIDRHDGIRSRPRNL